MLKLGEERVTKVKNLGARSGRRNFLESGKRMEAAKEPRYINQRFNNFNITWNLFVQESTYFGLADRIKSNYSVIELLSNPV